MRAAHRQREKATVWRQRGRTAQALQVATMPNARCRQELATGGEVTPLRRESEQMSLTILFHIRYFA